ncbi:MAG: helix-turn-helix transcriptional regulator [Bdellovibrionia bacterium]
MTASAILKKVREAYPEVFKELPKPKLKLVESAILYASKLSGTDDLLSESEHQVLMKEITGKVDLTSGNRLKAYRMREDLSQSDLAKRCKIPQANISAMEAGRRPIGVQTAKKLAKALGCDYRQLV